MVSSLLLECFSNTAAFQKYSPNIASLQKYLGNIALQKYVANTTLQRYLAHTASQKYSANIALQKSIQMSIHCFQKYLGNIGLQKCSANTAALQKYLANNTLLVFTTMACHLESYGQMMWLTQKPHRNISMNMTLVYGKYRPGHQYVCNTTV